MSSSTPATASTPLAINDRLIIDPDPLPEASKGLIMPDDAKEGIVSRSGLILSRGDRCHPYLHPGARVYFNKYVGLEVEWEGRKLLSMKEEDILAVELPPAPATGG